MMHWSLIFNQSIWMRTKSVRTKRNLPWKELHAVSQEAHNFLKHNQAAIFSSKSFQSGCTVQTSKIQGLRPQLGSNQDPRNPVCHWFLVIAKYNLAFKSFLLELQTNIFFFFSFWTLKKLLWLFSCFPFGRHSKIFCWCLSQGNIEAIWA